MRAAVTAQEPSPPPSNRPVEVGHLLTLEQMLCRERPYVRAIPPTRPNTRFLISSPARKRSFCDVTLPVTKRPVAFRERPRVLRSVLYEEHLRDVLHRVSRTTYSYKTKFAALARPEELYTCCPRKGF